MTLPLLTIVGGRKTRFLAEELREMAWVRIADLVRNRDHTFRRLSEHATSGVQSQFDLILGRRNTRRALEQSVKVKVTHTRQSGQPRETEFLCEMLVHPVGDPSQFEARQ